MCQSRHDAHFVLSRTHFAARGIARTLPVRQLKRNGGKRQLSSDGPSTGARSPHTAYRQPPCNISGGIMTSSHSHKCFWSRRLLSVTMTYLLSRSFVGADAVERTSAQVLLLDITLPPMTPKQYIDTFWHDAKFYEDFLKKSGTPWI